MDAISTRPAASIEKREAVARLAVWLKRVRPGSVLIPLRASSKAPLFAHRDGAWTWAEWDAFFDSPRGLPQGNRREKYNGHDVAILLRDMAVLDFDTLEAAEQFERRFPELARAPMETTKKGRHYYFARTDAMDAARLYDRPGCAVAVDFKTLCSTGNCGTIVCAPSTGKAWVRALTEFDEVPAVSQEIIEWLKYGCAPAVRRVAEVHGARAEEWATVERLLAVHGLRRIQRWEAVDTGFRFWCHTNPAECPCCKNWHEKNNWHVYQDADQRWCLRNFSSRCTPICMQDEYDALQTLLTAYLRSFDAPGG